MKRLISLLLACVMVFGCAGASAETIKHERVYVVTGANGEIRSLTDNVRLENKDALDEIVDRTLLQNVQNVGGHEAFTLDGETLTWQAQGRDITYQGTGAQEPALLPRVALTLDGQEITAAQLKDRTGEARLEVSYDTAAGTPALAVTLVLLPENGVTGIVTENAAVLSEAGRQLLVGWAVPGVDEDLNLPASFSATFQADHADLSWMMTLVTTSPIEAACKEIDEHITFDAHMELDGAEKLLVALEKGEALPETDGMASGIAAKINELNDGLTTLDDSAKQLAEGMAQADEGAAAVKDGAAQLSEGSQALSGALDQIAQGAAQLAEGSGSLSAGADTLSAGMADADAGAGQLKAGLDVLTANNETLNQGAETIFSAILSTANQQLAAAGLDAAGIALPELTAENYGQVLDAVLAQLDPEALKAAALDQVEAAVRTQVEAGADQVRAAVEQAVQARVLEGVLAAAQVPMTAQQYAAAVEAKQVPDEQAKAIGAAVDAQMKTDAVQTQLEQAVQEQIEALVKENTEKYMASDETVAARLAQARDAAESISALKAQLEQISAFVTGLNQYTAGVAQAAQGAAALRDGLDQLTDGAGQLAAGADSLNAGAAQLKEGTAQAAAGAVSLQDGAAQLAQGTLSLADGTAQLKDGAARLQAEGTAMLRDTLLNAEKEAAQKLLPYVRGDLSNALRVYEQTRDQARNSSYDLHADGMKDVTVYIIRTDLQ